MAFVVSQILAVLLVHSVPPLADRGDGVTAINSFFFFHLGVFGVDLFFVLSGFLIICILLGLKPRPGFFGSFYIRLFLRLFPVYYGFLVVLATLIPFQHRIAGTQPGDYRGNWLWYIFNFSNYKPVYADDPYLDQFWSLAVENQFYLTWPLPVFLLSKRRLAGSAES
jgi:peptidoglycan/LPS O-acetylase OafA/YrhL